MAKDQNIIDLFIQRNGVETKVELNNGKILSIWNIAWGYDFEAEYAHITTNISPEVPNASIDIFYTNEIIKILTNEE